MTQFDLSLWLQDKSRKVVTRDGRPVRIICWDKKDSTYPIVGLVTNENGLSEKEGCCSFTINGKAWGEAYYDLFFADEEEELTEFEKMLRYVLECYCYYEVTSKSEIESLKLNAKRLLDLARKELEATGWKDSMRKYKEAYEQGKQDALKDLPKWKKTNETKEFEVHVCVMDEYMYPYLDTEVNEGEYYIELSDLITLPKEE